MSNAADLTRIAHLEHLVENLYRHLGLELPTASPTVSAAVRDLALQGKEIEAIKLHRRETGKSLGDAKADIDALS